MFILHVVLDVSCGYLPTHAGTQTIITVTYSLVIIRNSVPAFVPSCCYINSGRLHLALPFSPQTRCRFVELSNGNDKRGNEKDDANKLERIFCRPPHAEFGFAF